MRYAVLTVAIILSAVLAQSAYGKPKYGVASYQDDQATFVLFDGDESSGCQSGQSAMGVIKQHTRDDIQMIGCWEEKALNIEIKWSGFDKPLVLDSGAFSWRRIKL